jgi:2-dehydropantoate 2-reductase
MAVPCEQIDGELQYRNSEYRRANAGRTPKERTQLMRTLVVGAGALGGYFGGRLLQAQRDVTFLLRPARAAQLQKTGLNIRSKLGDAHVSNPPFLLSQSITGPFDLVIVACKSYDLQNTMESFAAAVGSDTAILPLLNGVRHLDRLKSRFAAHSVLGGQCLISASLDPDGTVVHHNELHSLTFGELQGGFSSRAHAIEAEFGLAKFDSKASETILHDMWEKWVFIASAAGLTTLMRASVGDIVASGGAPTALALLQECTAIASAEGFAPRSAATDRARSALTAAGSAVTASMLKDIERGSPIERDHIVGDLLRRAPAGPESFALLKLVDLHLKSYESRRQREAPAP